MSSKDSAICRPHRRNHFSPVNRERKREPILKKLFRPRTNLGQSESGLVCRIRMSGWRCAIAGKKPAGSASLPAGFLAVLTIGVAVLGNLQQQAGQLCGLRALPPLSRAGGNRMLSRKSTEHELQLLSSLIPEGNVRTLCSLPGMARSAEMTLVLVAAARNTSAAVWSSNPPPTLFGHNNETHPTS